MGLFSKSEERGELVALLDIGSSSVGGALFYMRKSGVPNIVFSFREPIELEKDFNFDQFFSATLKTLEVVASRLGKSGVGSPKKFFCVVSSPWYGSQTRVVRFGKDESFVFTSSLADELIKKEVEFFKQEHIQADASSGVQMLPIELKNMKTVLNGYPTEKPLGQRVRELEMTLFISMSSEEFLKKIKEVVVRHFHRDEIKFSSFAFVSFAVVRQLFANRDNFLLVDIGGELTDISLVKQDVLATAVSFPKGVNFMAREIEKALSCPSSEARSLLSLYKSGHASELAAQKLSSLIEKLKREWLSEFQTSLASLSHDISVPSSIYLTVEPDFADFFSDIIRQEQFSQYTLTESKFEISLLGMEELHGEALLEKDVPRDPFVILGSIYINRFLR